MTFFAWHAAWWISDIYGCVDKYDQGGAENHSKSTCNSSTGIFSWRLFSSCNSNRHWTSFGSLLFSQTERWLAPHCRSFPPETQTRGSFLRLASVSLWCFAFRGRREGMLRLFQGMFVGCGPPIPTWPPGKWEIPNNKPVNVTWIFMGFGYNPQESLGWTQ